MFWWVPWFTFAWAIVNCDPVTFDLGKEYLYDYHAVIHMKHVDEFNVNAQILLTCVDSEQGEQELKLDVAKFAITCTSKDENDRNEENKDFSKWFSLVITRTGEITQVYYEVNEDKDILSMKKGIANLLSGKFLGKREAGHVDSYNGTWLYNTTERGHEGEHNASYSVEPTMNGKMYTKERTHNARDPSHAQSSSTKSVLIDQSLGTIHSVTSIERVEVKHKTKPGFDPYDGLRGAIPASEFQDLDIPEIKVGSTSSLTFKGVREAPSLPERPEHLVSRHISYDHEQEHIVGQRAPKQGSNMTSLLKNVDKCLECIRDQPATGSEDVLRCSTDLVITLLALPDDKVTSITDSVFQTNSDKTEKQIANQEAILDSLFMMHTNLSQNLILKYTLTNHEADRVLFRRSLFQLSSLEPIYEGIRQFVESILDKDVDDLYECYGSEDVHIMFLSFGSVSRKFMDTPDSQHVASKFNNKMKNMLGIHDPHDYRMKRSVLSESAATEFDWRKVVYIEALGNERHPSSFEHIISHVNSTVSSWVKRAGIHALRYYNHTEAAQAILFTAMEDEHSEVRHEASLAYEIHPAADKSLTKRSVRSDERPETQEVAKSRKKRGILDAAFEFKLDVPGVNWKKGVGSQQLGAEFGVIMLNTFDLKISPLSGHFKVEIHDEAYARALIGILGLKVDFFMARVCFKGAARYNLNLLQEFDPSLNEETVRLVTEGIREVSKAIKTGIDILTSIINGKLSFKGIVDDFLEVFRSLPEMVMDIRDAALKAIKDFGNLVMENLPPFLKPMRDLIDYVSNLMSDIKLDVMDLYYALVQPIETIIPRSVKQIFESVKDIIKSFPDLFKDPKKAVAQIGKGVISIALSIADLRSVKQTITNVSLLRDEKPYWMNLEEVYTKIKEMTVHAFTSLTTGVVEWVEEVVQAEDPISQLTNGKMSQQLIREMIIDSINEIIDRLLEPFERLKGIGNGFIEKVFKIFNLVEDMKEGYEKVKKGFKAARALIDKVFGPKFDKEFPKLLREGDTCFKNGFFPSKLDGYSYEGVDLVANESSKIVAPLSGIIQRTGRYGEARMIETELPEGQEILIYNVDLDDNIDNPEDANYEERRVAAGDEIGTALRSECTNHIHVVLRDKTGAVMDPSRLLAPRPPEKPEWKQFCNDKRVVRMGETLVAEPFVGSKDEEDTSGNLPDGDNPEQVDSSQEPSVSGGELYNAVSRRRRKKRSFMDTADDILDLLVTKTKAYLSQFSLRRITMGAAAQFLHNFGMTQTLYKITAMINTIKGALDDSPCVAPSQMTADVLQMHLINQGLPVSGDRETMVKMLTNPDPRCPYIAMGMGKSVNMHCLYSDSCLGVQCCLSIDVLGTIQKTYKAYIRVDSENFVLQLGFQKWSKKVPFYAEGITKNTFDTDIKFSLFGDDVHILCKYIMETTGETLTLTFGCGICSLDNPDSCISFVNILEDAIFQLPYIAPDGTVAVHEVDFEKVFDRESIKEQLEVGGNELLNEAQASLADRMSDIFKVTLDLLLSNPRCPIPSNMENSELDEELLSRNLPVDGTREERENRITKSNTECTTNTNVDVTFQPVLESFRDRFMYRVTKSCMRIEACLDAYIPLLDVTKTFTAALELDPCNYKLHLEFEKFSRSLWLIDYQWGQQSMIDLTDGLALKYSVDKTDLHFIVNAAFVCGTIDFDAPFIDNQQIPIPICNSDFKLPGAGDLNSFADSMAGQLSQAAFDVFTETLGINGILQNTQKCILPTDPSACDEDPADFIPPLLKDILHCKMLDNCWGVSCCLNFGFDIPFSDTHMNVSVPFIFKYDPCQYSAELNLGNDYKMTRWFVEYEWGKVNSLSIGKVVKDSVPPVQISYKIDKYDTSFVVDVQLSICLPLSTSEKVCVPETINLHLLENERIPSCDIGIDSSLGEEFPDFSFSGWLAERGRDIGTTLGEAGREYITEALHLDAFLLKHSCVGTEYPYSPTVNGWNIECTTSHTSIFDLPDFVTCHMSPDCKTVSCCVDIPQIDFSIKASVQVDLCQNNIVAGLETMNNQIEKALSDYRWGENKTMVMAKVFQVSYNVQKPDTDTYILNLWLRACFEKKGDCLIDRHLITDLEIPRVYCRSSETVMKHLENVTHQCSMDPDLQGITCSVYMDDETMATLVYFRVDPCLDRYQYAVDDMRWNSTLSSLPQGMDTKQELDQEVSLMYSVLESGMAYNVNISFEVCYTVNGTYTCDSLPVLSGFPLYKVNCTENKRRKRRSVDDLRSVTIPEIKNTLRDLYQEKASSSRVNEMLNALKQEQEALREKAFQGLSIEEFDSETKAVSLIKSMGKNNPMTMLYSNDNSGWEVEVTGADLIMNMLSGTNMANGKGSQTFVPGEGLTGHGVQILSKQLANMTIGDLGAFMELSKIDPEVIHQLTLDFVDLAKALYADTIALITSGNFKNAFEAFDIKLRGKFDFPRQTNNLFTSPPYIIPLGPVVIIFEFGSDYYLGMELGVGAGLMSMVAEVGVTPYAGLSVWGGASFGFVLYAEIRLYGYIMDISFPAYAELDFSRFPIDVGLKMDLVLVPLRLQLDGLVTLSIKIPFCCRIRRVLFRATLWKSKASSINKNIFSNIKEEEDESPPQFSSLAVEDKGRGKRDVTGETSCVVTQLPGYDYTEPELELMVAAIDDKSQVKFFVDVGTFPGGSNTLKEFQLGGALTRLSMTLRHTGVPLYFTVYAQNSQGSRSSVSCKLGAFDVTEPLGRVKAEYLSTSNPHVMTAFITVHDETEILESNAAIGYGEEIFGDQLVPWHAVEMDKLQYDPEPVTDSEEILKHFSGMIDGRLLGGVLTSRRNVYRVSDCAKWCLSFAGYSCLSINYDYGVSGTCEILKAIEGHDHITVKDGLFTHFERRGSGLSLEIERTNLNLQHNTLYIISLSLKNSLGYTNVISSKGVIFDRHIPDPGFINNTKSNMIERMPCMELIPDNRQDLKRYCIGHDHALPNHRILTDGPYSGTVFNGMHYLYDERFTRINNYLSVNWDGFHDNETGILVYSWTFGTEYCDDLFDPHTDPHSHLSSPTHWTHKAQKYPLPPPYTRLPDGSYYVTVRAINGVEYGGPMAVTVCHSTPYVVDTSHPFVHEIHSIRYDENSFFIYADIDVGDPHSGISEYDICFGRTSRDCDLLPWYRYDIKKQPKVSHRYRIQDGVPTWLRIRAVNKVDLNTVRSADQPIIVDGTAPFPGNVHDGPTYQTDLTFSKDTDMICANWENFYDPESGISEFLVGVGSAAGKRDIVPLRRINYKQHHACLKVSENNQLVHQATYYTIVYAVNGGIVKRNASAISNGVTIDVTRPMAGDIVDGLNESFEDLEFSPSESTLAVQWRNFRDPESGIANYFVKSVLTRSGESTILKNWTKFDSGTDKAVWKNAQLKHKDYLESTVKVTNRATNEISLETNGFLVDLTAPVMHHIHDGLSKDNDIHFQNSANELAVNFDIQDAESGLRSFKFQIFERYNGNKKRIWPVLDTWYSESDITITAFQQTDLNLIPGAEYTYMVASENRAGITSTHETTGVIVDTTPPTVRWFHVGVFSGEEENLHNGHVFQADHTGIKLSYLAFDSQSGITDITIKIGTSQGADDIKPTTTYKTNKRDMYIDDLQLTDTVLQDMVPVYYITLQVQNGAGQTSDEVYSTPVVVVPEDVPGNVVEGIVYSGDIFEGDIDYTYDASTMSITFEGFKSTLHGIKRFVWAVGTSPDREDILPFTEKGLAYTEESDAGENCVVYSGTAHLPVTLEHGKLYYVTLRGITHGGHALQSITDGIMVDQTPPSVNMKSLLNHETQNEDVVVYYETGIDSLSASWEITDVERISNDVIDNIEMVAVTLGTYPGGSDIHPVTYWLHPGSDTGELSDWSIVPSGITNYLSIMVENKARGRITIDSPGVVVDDTPPEPGQVSCSPYAQPNTRIACQWSGFIDNESPIMSYEFYIGSQAGYEDGFASVTLPPSTREYFVQGNDLQGQHGDEFYATVVAHNSIDEKAVSFSSAIFIDTTPPMPGTVVEVAQVKVVENGGSESLDFSCTTDTECNGYDITCQSSLTSVSVSWSLFVDDESGIQSYYIALGTTEANTDIVDFKQLHQPVSDRTYTFKGLNLMGTAKVHAKIMAVNGAGLSVVSTSNGVYLSYISQGLEPLWMVGVWDADPVAIGDIDYQVDSSMISAEWDTSGEPCPAVDYQWAIVRLDGEVVQDYIDKQGSTSGFNDQLNMQNGETYYSLLKVTNTDGYVYVLRSDGVTIHSDPLVPGSVYDGDVFGYDLNVVTSREEVTCNWDGFGIVQNTEHEDILTGDKINDQEVPDNQKISRYEVALGTDRRLSSTRANVVPFTDVGTDTSHTFQGLDLVPGNAKYYCTVKAYSSSFSTAQSMSNGFYVTTNGGVTAGQIEMSEFTASLTTLEIPWQGFHSKEGMMMYYIAVSTHFWPTNMECKHYIDGGDVTMAQKKELFDAYMVASIGSNTYAEPHDLSLLQGHTYNVFVMGVDNAGECNMTVARTTIDVTKPDRGAVSGGPYYGMALSYTSDDTTIHVKWAGYTDDVSGIKSFTVSLFYGLSCDNDEIQGQIGEEFTLEDNIDSFTFSDLILESQRPYYVKIDVVNGADLVITDMTEPIVLSMSTPTAGSVVEGSVYTDDVVWWGSTTEFTGTILHYPNPHGKACPSQLLSLTDQFWLKLQGGALIDVFGQPWNLFYNPEFVTIDDTGDLQIKMWRDSKSENILSGGYWRTADLESTGTYQVSVIAASEEQATNNNIVTEMLFVDGVPEEGIVTHYYKEKVDWSDEDCSCCYESDWTLCTCSNCTAFLDSDNDDEYDNQEQQTRKKSCGLQIYSGPEPFGVLWYQSEIPDIPVMEVKVPLPEDVSSTFHTYTMVFQTHSEDSTSQTCFKAFIDGTELSSICGIEPLSISSNFLIHVWNRDRYLPYREDDLFTWWVYATVKDIIFPPAAGESCRYGDPFRGGDIPIVRYEAAIGSASGLDDKHPFEEVYSPCLPCTDSCSRYTCDDTCKTNDMSLIPLTLQGLNLQSLKQKGNVTELAANYFTVKAVLGNGGYATSSSNGFYVDVTPPVLDELALLYIDVDQGDYAPVEYQGSTNTIKVIWLCTDDESEIMEYRWALGSESGLDDIQQFTSTDQNPSGINDQLDGILEDESRYYVSIYCRNEAGLETIFQDTKGVIVLLTPPDPENVSAEIVGAEKFDYDIKPSNAFQTHNPTSVGASWQVSPDKSITYYEFCLGSSHEVRQDILPCVRVGYNASAQVKIENGCLMYNGHKMYNLNELKTDSSASTTGGKFNMDPGRSIFVSLRLGNEARKYSYKLLGTVTVNSAATSYSGVSDGTSPISLAASSDTSLGRKKRSVPIELELVTPPDLPQGETVMLISLTEDDLTKEYTSSSSTDFVPYIVNPNTTMDQVERVLVGRIEQFEMSFSVVTVGQVELPGPMEITFTQVNTNPLPGDSIHMLVHWNIVDQVWKLTGLTCINETETERQDVTNSTTTIKVCNTRGSGNDTEIYFKEETQFAIVLAKADVVNNAPYMESPTNLAFNEDQADGYSYQFIGNDTEGDSIGFLLISFDSGNVVQNITLSPNGSLSFDVCVHCYGTLTLEVQVYDIPHSSEVESNSTTVNINVNISSVNDPPNIFLVDDSKVNLLGNDITEEVQIFRNNIIGGLTYFTAVVGAYDFDTNDNLEVLYSASSLGDYTVESFDSTYDESVTCNETLCMGEVPDISPSNMKWMFARISYRKTTNFTGIDTIKMAVRDSADVLSDIIILSVYNLDFPCLNGGFCSAKTQTPCDNPLRLNDFDENYSCVCPIGWTGIHCGEDVNECKTSPCSSPLVCKNTPGTYSCYFPLYFILPLVAGLLVIIVLVVLFLFRNRIFRSLGKNQKGKNGEANFGSQIIMNLLSRDPSVHPGADNFAQTAPQNTTLTETALDDYEESYHPTTRVPVLGSANLKFDPNLLRRMKEHDDGFAHPKPQPGLVDTDPAMMHHTHTDPLYIQREASIITTRSIEIDVKPLADGSPVHTRPKFHRGLRQESTTMISKQDVNGTEKAVGPVEQDVAFARPPRRLPPIRAVETGIDMPFPHPKPAPLNVPWNMKSDSMEDESEI